MKALVVLIFTLFTAQAFAVCGFNAPRCSCGHYADSYGFGLQRGLFGKGGKPLGRSDQTCFNLGVSYGKQISKRMVFNCSGEFKKSKIQGLNGKVHSSALSACNNAGYQYGQSVLRVGARLGKSTVVGQNCVDAYSRGKALARKNRPITLTSNSKVNACLRAGHYDESWL